MQLKKLSLMGRYKISVKNNNISLFIMDIEEELKTLAFIINYLKVGVLFEIKEIVSQMGFLGTRTLHH